MKKALDRLVNLFASKGYLSEENIDYGRNRVFRLLKVSGWPKSTDEESSDIMEDLKTISAFARENGIIEGEGTSFYDDFTAELTDCLIPPPDRVREKFMNKSFNGSMKDATDWFYELNTDTQYIKKDRTEKNIRWKHPSVYGDLDITVNLSKPEKTPEEIKMAAKKSHDYPSCLLCRENEGLGGQGNPPRQHHRIIPVSLSGDSYYFQYSPYAYFNEHCIVLSEKHVPMAITPHTADVMLDFVSQFPHYFLAGNADLPIVGGSILSHDHFQGGDYVFPVERADYSMVTRAPHGECGILNWPVSAVKLKGTEKYVSDSSGKILEAWKKYSNNKLGILNETEGVRHNTVNFFFRKSGKDEYSAIILLRNNRCDEEHPDGIFHTGKRLQVIKKENIGIIEAIGMAILPPRLKEEMNHFEELPQYSDWLSLFTDDQKKQGPRYLIGETFRMLLEDVGVFKHTEEGRNAFIEFLKETL